MYETTAHSLQSLGRLMTPCPAQHLIQYQHQRGGGGGCSWHQSGMLGNTLQRARQHPCTVKPHPAPDVSRHPRFKDYRALKPLTLTCELTRSSPPPLALWKGILVE